MISTNAAQEYLLRSFPFSALSPCLFAFFFSPKKYRMPKNLRTVESIMTRNCLDYGCAASATYHKKIEFLSLKRKMLPTQLAVISFFGSLFFSHSLFILYSPKDGRREEEGREHKKLSARTNLQPFRGRKKKKTDFVFH